MQVDCDGISCDYEYDPERGCLVCSVCEHFKETDNYDYPQTCFDCGCQFNYFPGLNTIYDLCHNCTQQIQEYIESEKDCDRCF